MTVLRDFLVAFSIFLVLGSLVAWVYANSPVSEPYVALSVLAGHPLNTQYFPNNTSTLNIARLPTENISWIIGISNHMRSVQLYHIYILLANKTIPGPDPSTNHPLADHTDPPPPELSVYQEYQAVLNDETWNMTFQWSISNATLTGTTVTIHGMIVNGITISSLNVTGQSSDIDNFRLVIELWTYTYDIASPGYLFTYVINGSVNSVFNQIWFTLR